MKSGTITTENIRTTNKEASKHSIYIIDKDNNIIVGKKQVASLEIIVNEQSKIIKGLLEYIRKNK